MTATPKRTLRLPPGAIVSDARAQITAAGVARWTTIGAVAQVRSESDASMHPTASIIIDFGSQVTVSGLRFDNGWDQLDVVGGSALVAFTTPNAHALKSFAATPVSQLRLKIGRTEAPPVVAVTGSVLVALPAAELEIFVNGTRAWVRPGAAEPEEKQTTFDAEIDLTRALQDEVDAGRVALEVTVGSRTPAALTLGMKGSYLSTHQVTFAEGPTRSIAATAEGPLPVALGLPSRTSVSQVSAVHATITAQSGPERVLPPDAPQPSTDAALIVDPDRAASILLPAGALATLATLAGVRVPLRAGVPGAELRGVLRYDKAGEPGGAIPHGALGPTTVEPGADVRWVSLLLPKPQKLPAKQAVWLDVVATRGSVQWPLAAGGAGGADVRRQTPGGGYRRLSTVSHIETNAAAVRLIGIPAANAPLFPVGVSAAGADPAAITTAGATATVSLGFPDAVPATKAASGGPAGAGSPPRSLASDERELALVLTARTAGTFTLSDVSIDYGRTEIKA